MRSVLLLLVVAVAHPARAQPARPAPLVTLKPQQVATLATALRSSDLALIESDPTGALKQLTTITFAAAPPVTVRDVVAHPERYAQFVRNMSKSQAHANADGTIDYDYSIDYTVQTVEGRHRYVFLPNEEGQGAPPIDMFDPDEGGVRHYRWEFVAVPGGTLLVLYGYMRIPLGGLLEKMLKRAPTLEHGLALITQMTLLLAMKTRAEQLVGAQPTPPAGPPPGLGFLLERGTVALFRTSGRRVSEISLIDRAVAPAATVLQVAGQPSEWSRFVPSIAKSSAAGMSAGLPTAEVEQALPLMSWDTRWGVLAQGSSVDLFGLEGDLQHGRLRWDVRGLPNGRSELVLRAVAQFDHGSVLMRQLYKLEPLFEYGVDVGLQLVLVRGIKQRAELISGGPTRAAR
jgi:hypothetical protein